MADAAPVPVRGLPVGKIVIAALLLGLFYMRSWRIRPALTVKATVAAERDKVAKEAQVAESAAARTGSRSVAGVATGTLIHGVLATWKPEVSVEGTLTPIRESDLSFRAPGRLAVIRVKQGVRVRAGTVLSNLDKTEASAQLQAAAAQVKAAEAQLLLASDGAKRMGSLLTSGSASQAQGVQASGQEALAGAQLEVARAQLAVARASLANCTLAAPFAGTITRVPAGPGAVVNPGAALFHLQDTSDLKLVATVGEGEAGLFHVGSEVSVRTADGRVALGRITAILPSVDTATRRVPIEALIPNSPRPPTVPLLAGIFVSASIGGEQALPVLQLPATALRPGSQDEVMVAVDGRLTVRRVAYATAPDGSLLVRRGLSAAESVLAAPIGEAKNGDLAPATTK